MGWAAVAEAIVALVQYYYDGEEKRAELDFRAEILKRLDAIGAAIVQAQQMMKDLGVVLLDAVGQVAVTQATADLMGQLGTLDVIHDTLDTDRLGAQAAFTKLSAATIAATAHRAAIAPLICLAFAAQLSILRRAYQTPDLEDVLEDMKRVYLRYFNGILEPGEPGSLLYQKVDLDSILKTVDSNIAALPDGRTLMGTHNYGWSRVYLRSEITATTHTVAREETRRIPRFISIGGQTIPVPTDKETPAKRIREVEIEKNTELRGSELILFTTPQTGSRRVPKNIKAICSTFGGDRYGGFYDNWLATVATALGENYHLRAAIRTRRIALLQTIDTVEALKAFCETTGDPFALLVATPDLHAESFVPISEVTYAEQAATQAETG